MNRTGALSRKTRETEIKISVNLDGKGDADIQTGIGFFDHMLETLARHSGIDLKIQAHGDLQVDDHHTVEDVGICLGKAINQALKDKKGINRFGWALCPMDEALVRVALDLSGRPHFVFESPVTLDNVETLQGESVPEFFKAMTFGCEATLHIDCVRGDNTHHLVESLFKTFARALKQAVAIVNKGTIPSTKGML
jgi:imidazoleglycerol-phosphate dehydratase